MQKCGLKKGKRLRPYQSVIRDEIFEDLEEGFQNFFISLPQGAGKTVIALATLSELINEDIVENALVVLPRKVLVDQWVEEVQKMFYGMTLVKYTPERGITQTLRKLRYSDAVGMAMTAHSFKRRTEKKEIREDMFEAVLVDESADIIPAKDFFEKYRLSSYMEGLEKWDVIKLFTQPHEIDKEKLKQMIKKFGGEKTKEIRRIESELSIKELDYEIKDTIPVDDPDAQHFIDVLDDRRRRARRNIHKALDDLGIEGYRENLETLLNPRTSKRLEKTYDISKNELEDLKNFIRTYILIRHLNRWFLYSNRTEIERTILSGQEDVEHWLKTIDKKLQTLATEVRKHLENNEQVYIYSDYVSTAKQIKNFLKEKLDIPSDSLFLITGETEEDQFVELEKFQKKGDILIASPVFEMGTDIPSADVMFVFTPPFNREKLHQVVKRIRGGQLKFIAYQGSEKSSVDNLVGYLQEEVGE
ncbi:hypothetical protein AKJ45_02390 [candidate division MSBL1 archaeon SCGC-AAA261F19]|uniref:Helicase C-terminal domain-containing protein n=1 Tax=candidate division MSBL1 archaeon SCGC-AAA261F19 TaxID=1698275 RepID=A0A133V9P7_9EURY|nr:hypothetical protein AKJ45_02390 [candidate division MSBL1 archaeon SCGC-AAA261F19]